MGAPVSCGAGRLGCEIGPGALRNAGLIADLQRLGRRVADYGDLTRGPIRPIIHGNAAIKHLPEVAAWIDAVADAAYFASRKGLPILLGGDHSIAAGSLAGLSRNAREAGTELFVLWLDAHPDFHTLDSTCSGNLHGVPLAYATGQRGFEGCFPQFDAPIKPENICLMGLRSVDPAERRLMDAAGINFHGMDAIRRYGAEPLLRPFLDRIRRANGHLHVSFDADFLDPHLAPGVGTGVPDGADFEIAQTIMDAVRNSGVLSSVELVELNPLLDIAGKTAKLMIKLIAQMIGPASRAPDRISSDARNAPKQKAWSALSPESA